MSAIIDAILEQHLEMYKLAEAQWQKLLKEEKENTPLGKKWVEEMDYWWNRLSVEQRKTLFATAKAELETKFAETTKKFEEFLGPDKS